MKLLLDQIGQRCVVASSLRRQAPHAGFFVQPPLPAPHTIWVRSWLVRLSLALWSSTAWPQETHENLWVTNGGVYAVTASDSTLYLGGNFSEVGPATGSWLGLDATSGSPQLPYPGVVGYVRAAAPDGMGGWFIGGLFSSVAGQSRNCLAHLDAAGNLTSWAPNATGTVSALVVSGNTVYVGGYFNTIGATSRNYLAALNATTGALLSWNPNANGTVLALAVSGTTVYVGGGFTTIGGTTRNRLAAVNATTGALLSWNPNANSTVTALALNGTTVYVGGYFTTIGAPTRNHLAAVGATTGVLLSWNPNANGTVLALTVSGSTVYAGGYFTTIGATSRNYLAALSVTTGAPLSWNPNANEGVSALVVSGTTVYVGGYFTAIGATTRNRLAAVDGVSGALSGWDPRANAGVSVLAVSGGTVYAGGSFGSVGGVTRNDAAAIDIATGVATSWNPNPNSFVEALELRGNAVYIGGHFTTIDGQPRDHIAAIDAATGAVLNWGQNLKAPIVTGGWTVNAVAFGNGSIYVGGDFPTMGGLQRSGIAALDSATGEVMAWDPLPGVNTTVHSIEVVGPTVYVGGLFTNIGGQARSNIAALDAMTGLASPWNPSADGLVKDIKSRGSILYVGGSFTSIGGEIRSAVAALDGSTGLATTWDPAAGFSEDGGVYSLALSGGTVYVGGQFGSIGGLPLKDLAAITATGAVVSVWDSDVSQSPVVAEVHALTTGRAFVFAGGSFSGVRGRSRSSLAGISEALSITGLERTSGWVNGSILQVVHGAGFQSGVTVKLVRLGQPDIIGTAVSVAPSGESLTATFDLSGAAEGVWDVVVTNPDLISTTLPSSFTVVQAHFYGLALMPGMSGETYEVDVENGFARQAGSLTGQSVTFTTAQVSAGAPGEATYALLDPGIGARIATLDGTSVTAVATVQASRASGVALDPFGSGLYVAHGSGSATDRLARVTPSTGIVQDLGAIQFQSMGTQLDALAFSPQGRLFGLESVGVGQGTRVWRLDPRTRQAILVGTTATEHYGYQDAGFLGAELWATRGTDGSAIHISTANGTVLESTTLDRTGLFGLGEASCTSPSVELVIRDNPTDGGGAIRLDWTSQAPPGGLIRYDIYRASSSCALVDVGATPVATVNSGGPRVYVDSIGVQNYTAYQYRIDAVTTLGAAASASIQGGPQLESGPVAAHPDVVINEFAPSGGVPNPMQTTEFVELRNLSSSPIDLTGWYLGNGTDKEILAGPIPGNGYFTHTLAVISLPNAGGTIELLPPDDTSFAVDRVDYGTEGGAPTAPAGYTISRVNGTDASDPDVDSFGTSTPTPGTDNEVAPNALGSSIVMNEVYYGGTAGEQDYVELYNPPGATVALDRFALGDGSRTLVTFKSELVLDHGAIVVLNDSTLESFTWDLATNQLYLYQILESGLLQLIDQLGWEREIGDPPPPAPTPTNPALIRVPNGTAVYLGDQGTNWLDCGGGVTLFYGPKSPGSPNASSSTIARIVDCNGSGQYLTISAALTAANSGDVVLVKPCTYDEVVTLRSGVSISGTGSSVGDAVIAGTGGVTVMRGTGVNSATSVSRVTIRGGLAAGSGSAGAQSGGGLQLMSSSPLFQNVRFEFNVARENGGAVSIAGGNPLFDGCVFQNNSALGGGGAVWVSSGSPTFERCLFVGNQSTSSGGALLVQAGTTKVRHSVLDKNRSSGQSTGVVHASGGTADVQYSLLTYSEDGAPLWRENSGIVHFKCGAFSSHAEWYDMVQGGVDTTSVVLWNPGYCNPEALNYAYASSSPVMALSSRCPDGPIGALGPPCGATLTDAIAMVAPQNSRLLPPSPNPFNPTTTVGFELATSGVVDLVLYDVRGRLVSELLSSVPMARGSYYATWMGIDQMGREVASGIYYVRLRLDGRSVGDSKKLVLVR